jgi:hypothetical protein
MNGCTVLIDPMEEIQKALSRTCPCCGLVVEDQLLSRCPRCTEPIPLAHLCAGCFKRSGCLHS